MWWCWTPAALMWQANVHAVQVVITSYDMMWRLTCPFCCAGGTTARKGRASAKDLPPACLGAQVQP